MGNINDQKRMSYAVDGDGNTAERSIIGGYVGVYADPTAFPIVGVTIGDLAVSSSPTGLYQWNGSVWMPVSYQRVTQITSSATPTPDSSGTDMFIITALATGATFGAPTGSPVVGQRLIIRIKDNGTARSLAFNAIYRFIGFTAPTTTVLGKTLYLGAIYNAVDLKWDVISIAQE